jgi:CRISPR system Cascade subunit CasC
MIVELHIIQNFAPSNLNRDDSNTPKDCEFGGYRRARISSQCIKRSVRHHPAFKNAVREAGGDLGVRTKRVIGKVADMLIENHGKSSEESQLVAEKIVTLLGVKRDDKKKDKTSILLFLGENELADIADISTKHWDVLQGKDLAKEAETVLKKELKALVGDERIKSGSYAADIALFGRMVADKNVKNMNVDAACQVAHAISTHKVEMEMDYFTAVDDLLPEEDTGSDMIGIVEFNSSCFYRYSAIDLNKLNENLGFNNDLLAATVKGYIDASVKAVPTGKQNSMAAQNPPGYVLVLVRKDGFPWSLANAFQKPVYAGREGSLEERSIAELEKYFARLKTVYGDGSIVSDASFNLYAENTESLENLLNRVSDTLNKEATE